MILVKYRDFNSYIEEVEIPIDKHRKRTIKIDFYEENGEKKPKLLDTYEDETIMHTITHEMSKDDLREYIAVLKQLFIQVNA